MKRVTIQDIAAKLELSRNTVAKALNGGEVSNATRMTVILKAYEMGYEKLDSKQIEEAKGLSRKNVGGTILVLFNRAESTFWNKILTGISDEINDNGYRMQMYIVEEDDLDATATLKAASEDTKGIILLCKFSVNFIEGLSTANLPITMFSVPKNGEDYLRYGNIIAIEGRNVISKIVQKLINQGKRTFSFVGGGNASMNIAMRYDGMRQTLLENGLIIDEDLMLSDRDSNSYYNFHVIEESIDNLPYLPEVFVCVDDDVAKYVATALMKKDMQTAKDTVILGFDNTLEPDFFKSDIITVEIKMEALGRRLVSTTLDKIMHPEWDNAIITVATYLVDNKEIH
ncbi:LacI family DNA-binding transcriptional regulator [Anaerosporobacter sp.]